MARARLTDELGNLTQEQPEIHVMIAGDPEDRLFPADKLRANKGDAVSFVETNWGGHGFVKKV